MDTLSFKTISNKKSIKKEWYIIDAKNKILGRLSSQIALLIRGKHKPYFIDNVNIGDNIIIINVDKIKLTGKKWNNKTYITYTGYPGGKKTILFKDLFKKNPKKILEKSIKGMLPKNRLRKQFLKNLHIYVGSKHNHYAQKPKILF
ncbi:MAG: 50S ribosomal protein L13 [Candidatus Bostrichicola ureolyticus]|nr:MAG: 50S ribosomal protein L13 [Candidatus Bostrichicola ureolyticus]